MITRIIGIPILGVTAAAKEGYNEEIAKYFEGEEGDHYIQVSGYLLAQVDQFHKFTFLEYLAPLDLQMPWLEQGGLPQPPKK
jgi:hypothetical protein